jgi:tight adherence protein C
MSALAANLLTVMFIFAVAGAVAVGSLGLYEAYLRKLMEEVESEKAQKEAAFLISLRKVLLRHLGAVNLRWGPPKYLESIRLRLIRAGNPAELLPEEFVGLQEFSAVAFMLFGFLLVATIAGSWAWPLAGLLFGAGYPWIWLTDQVKKRHLAITRALPYDLDLLTLSVEAGLDFAAAIGRVVEKGKQGPLAEELGLTLRHLKMGKTREESLRMLSDRVGLSPLTSFCNALIQADRMGTSLGKVLRIQSAQLRIERTTRAEKLANEAPVKMLLPLIACIFPTVFMILFGPIVFQFISGELTF